MSTPLELIKEVEAKGGRMWVEGGTIVILPSIAALPIAEELRQHKREIIRLLENRRIAPAHDPAEWRQDFIWWLDSTCKLHPRCFGGVTALHRSFCEWQIARDEVPCTGETFIRILGEMGFLTGVIEGVLLVSGLTLRDDLDAVAL